MSDIKLNMEYLLSPVSSESPVGRNMEYDPAYDEIRLARESDPDYSLQDAWSTTLRKADWQKVIALSEAFLTHASKDLQVSCWLTEALVHKHGVPGLLFGFRFLHQFISLYWEQCWPELADEGVVIREGKLRGLDRQWAKQLNNEPLLGSSESTLDFWQKVLTFEHTITLQPDSREELMESGDYSMETFNRWASSVSFVLLTEANDILGECQSELQQLERRYAELNPDADGAMFILTREKMDEMADLLRRLGDRIVPDVGDVMSLNVLADQDENQHHTPQSGAPKQVMSRDLAISQMLTIAHFFRQTEPSSGVPFLLERAARWAGMTLTEWLEEMLQDSNSLNDINSVLKGNNNG